MVRAQCFLKLKVSCSGILRKKILIMPIICLCLRELLKNAGMPMVLDADALTLIAKTGAQAIQKTHERCVLTPHGGEFARLFPAIAAEMPRSGKLEAARAAAREAGATVAFKGPDTVIAAPDGRAVIDALSPPWLATAGTGDVLAGLIGGLLAQGLDPFAAACAGVALHGAAARHAGSGLIADDLPSAIPAVLSALPGQA